MGGRDTAVRVRAVLSLAREGPGKVSRGSVGTARVEPRFLTAPCTPEKWRAFARPVVAWQQEPLRRSP